MSYSTIYADSLTAYQNGQNMANAIQKKIENVADNEVLFGNVDYSSSYDSILDNFSSSAAGDSSGDGSGDSSTEGPGQSGELAADGGTKATEEQIEQLRAAYQQVQDQQGWVGKAWNGIKNFFGHSNGSNAVEDTINKAAAGEISYEAAVEKLNTYASKQGSVVDVFANIASGLAVAAGVILAPVSFGASLAIGAGVGAAVKVGVKASNAATNNVEGDYSLKDGLKDGVTGAVGGVVTAATAGIGASATVVKEGGKVLVKETVKQGAIAGAKAGAIDGAVMGATNYTADAVFDGDEFTFGGLVSNTVTGAAGGAVVGGTIGGLTAGVRAHGANKAANSAADAADEAIASTPKVDIDSEVSAFTQQAKNMTTAQKGEYINNLIQEGKITSEADLLKFFDGNVGVAKTTMGSGNAYRQALKQIKEIQTPATPAAPEAPTSPEGTANLTFGQMAAKAKNNVVELFKKGANIKDMSPKDIKQAFTGKVNSTASEFKAAYEAMKQTTDYKTNLVFRTFVEDAFSIGSAE